MVGNPLLAAALEYAQRGWPVLPLYSPDGLGGCSCKNPGCPHPGKHPRTAHGVKDATRERATIQKWWTKWPDANVGIATGSVSGIIVLDIDARHGGVESLHLLERQHGPIPKGPEVLSGGGGFHYYFHAPDFKVKNKAGIAEGIDIRGDGGYIVAVPSRHATGRVYGWAEGQSPNKVSPPCPPPWVETLLASSARTGRRHGSKTVRVREGGRNDHLTRIAGALRQRGLTEEAILESLKVQNQEQCEPPLPESEVADIASSIARYPAGPTVTPEIGLVKRLADHIMLTEHFAQDPGGKLYRFIAGAYKADGSAHVKRLVKRLLENWNLTSKWSSARSEEVVEFIRVDAQRLWDCPRPDVLNVVNGLLHVESGQLKPHSPDYLSPVQILVVFDATATCPVWEAFVLDVFPQDARDIAWQIAGWLMLPDTSLQKAILLLGEGSNGKSTFLTGLSAFLGPTNVAAVSLHRLEVDRFSVARLVGKLANICADLPSSHLAGTSVFKALVGGDRVPAEYKYRDSFEFLPFARLVFSANHPPRSGDSTHAFFRRWYVVPFSRRFEGGEEIHDMSARLASPRELSGVLNKAVQARKHIQEYRGLTESASMAAAWGEFRAVTDPIAVWLDNWTIESSDSSVAKKDLLVAYNRASETAGRPPETETGFGLSIRRLRPNLKEGQRTVAGKSGVRVWLGLGFRSSEFQSPL